MSPRSRRSPAGGAGASAGAFPGGRSPGIGPDRGGAAASPCPSSRHGGRLVPRVEGTGGRGTTTTSYCPASPRSPREPRRASRARAAFPFQGGKGGNWSQQPVRPSGSGPVRQGLSPVSCPPSPRAVSLGTLCGASRWDGARRRLRKRCQGSSGRARVPAQSRRPSLPRNILGLTTAASVESGSVVVASKGSGKHK